MENRFHSRKGLRSTIKLQDTAHKRPPTFLISTVRLGFSRSLSFSPSSSTQEMVPPSIQASNLLKSKAETSLWILLLPHLYIRPVQSSINIISKIHTTSVSPHPPRSVSQHFFAIAACFCPCPLQTSLVKQWVLVYVNIKKNILFIYLCQVLVAACRIFYLRCGRIISGGLWDLAPWPEIKSGPPALRT